MSVNLNKVSFFYKHRTIVSLIALFVFTSIILIISLISSGGDMSGSETQSAIKSGSINPTSLSSLLMLDLPYHLLQKISFYFFGVSFTSIKLPSLVISILSIIGLVVLLRAFYKPSLAAITTILIVSTSPFLTLSQTGDPTIMLFFWPIAILATAVLLLHKKQTLKNLALFILSILLGASLYTPMLAMIILLSGLVLLIHPQIRLFIRQSFSSVQYLIALILFSLTITPLVLNFIHQPSEILMALFGISDFSTINPIHNLSLALLSLFDISGSKSLAAGFVTPFLSLPLLLVSLFGFYQAIKYHYSVKSYLSLSLLTIGIILSILNPSAIFVLIVPSAIFIGISINESLRWWNQTFPLNPYARAFLLTTVIAIVSLVSFTNYNYYLKTNRYGEISKTKTKDFARLMKEVNLNKDKSIAIVASPKDLDFYKLYAVANKVNLNVKTYEAKDINRTTEDIVIKYRNIKQAPKHYRLERIDASAKATADSDSLYVYKKVEK